MKLSHEPIPKGCLVNRIFGVWINKVPLYSNSIIIFRYFLLLYLDVWLTKDMQLQMVAIA